MIAKLTKKINTVPKKFSAQDYHYDDGIDPKDLLNESKPTKRKLFHT